MVHNARYGLYLDAKGGPRGCRSGNLLEEICEGTGSHARPERQLQRLRWTRARRRHVAVGAK
eukprot:scaffold165968_cov39-Prasinocladus_malaysianus.AAC.1